MAILELKTCFFLAHWTTVFRIKEEVTNKHEYTAMCMYVCVVCVNVYDMYKYVLSFLLQKKLEVLVIYELKYLFFTHLWLVVAIVLM